ncbi:MAG: tetratricopeptide repeat protein [Melioribacteraceae bacterium]|nr:tetratricopeptide repeat protein [Melioribacteraceae bacterium]
MSDKLNNNVLKCDVCGEENDLGTKACVSCGADLSNITPTEKSPESGQTEQSNSNQKESNSDHPINKAGRKKKEGQSLSPVRLLYIGLTLAVIGLLLLYGSGTFDPLPKVTTSNQNTSFQQQHGGVDLSKLEEINQLEKIYQANPNDHQTLLQLAHLLGDSRFFDKAIEKYTQYLQTHPNEADVWVDLGVCYFEKMDYAKAIEVMNKALELNPTHQIAHFNLGIINLSAGNHDEAISWWEKTAALNSESEIGKRAKELINQH